MVTKTKPRGSAVPEISSTGWTLERIREFLTKAAAEAALSETRGQHEISTRSTNYVLEIDVRKLSAGTRRRHQPAPSGPGERLQCPIKDIRERSSRFNAFVQLILSTVAPGQPR